MYTPEQQAKINAAEKAQEIRKLEELEYAAGYPKRLATYNLRINGLICKYQNDSRLGVVTLQHCVKFPEYANQIYALLEAIDSGKSKQSIAALSE